MDDIAREIGQLQDAVVEHYLSRADVDHEDRTFVSGGKSPGGYSSKSHASLIQLKKKPKEGEAVLNAKANIKTSKPKEGEAVLNAKANIKTERRGGCFKCQGEHHEGII